MRKINLPSLSLAENLPIDGFEMNAKSSSSDYQECPASHALNYFMDLYQNEISELQRLVDKGTLSTSDEHLANASIMKKQGVIGELKRAESILNNHEQGQFYKVQAG
jgi:uncharacterized protein with NAD-binding domain and iron-sulfur cluster